MSAFDSDRDADGFSRIVSAHLKRNNIKLKDFLHPPSQFWIKDTELDNFATQLRNRGVIKSAELNECRNKPPNEWNEYLYSIIFNSNVVVRYIWALEDSNNSDIVDKIKCKIPMPQQSQELQLPSTMGHLLNQEGVHSSISSNPATTTVNINIESLNMTGLGQVNIGNTSAQNAAGQRTCPEHQTLLETVANPEESDQIQATNVIVGANKLFCDKHRKLCFGVGVSLFVILVIVIAVIFLPKEENRASTTESQALEIFPNHPPVTTAEINPDFDHMTLPASTVNSDNVNNCLNFTISNPLTLIPPQLPPNKRVINLMINATEKYDWDKKWKIRNADLVHSLHLKGPFNTSDINYFLSSFPNLEILHVSSGEYLCDQFLGKYKPLSGPRMSYSIVSLIISAVGMPCENLYRFLTDKLSSSNVTNLTLAQVSVQFENVEWVQQLLEMHHDHLISLNLQNVSICSTEICALFNGTHFPKVKEAVLNFFPNDIKSAKDSLVNFNNGSPNIQKFESNINCSRNEWTSYRKNWQQIIVSEVDICDRP